MRASKAEGREDMEEVEVGLGFVERVKGVRPREKGLEGKREKEEDLKWGREIGTWRRQ